jgi:hypothetical protein
LSSPETFERLQLPRSEYGIHSLILAVQSYQDSLASNEVKTVHLNECANAPSDAALSRFISVAESIGIDVQLKPIVTIGLSDNPNSCIRSRDRGDTGGRNGVPRRRLPLRLRDNAPRHRGSDTGSR